MNFDQALMKYKYLEAIKYFSMFPCRLLDVGCKDGQFLYLVGQDFHDFDLHGIDIDKEALETASKNVDATFHHAEFEEWGEPGLTFDYITAFNVLEHVGDDHEFLYHCNRRMNQKGRLIVSVPNAKAFHKELGDMMGLTRPYQLTYADMEKGHKRNYDMGYLKGVIGNAGFDIIGERGVFFKPLPSDMLMQHYNPPLFDALYEMGKIFFDLCSTIMVVGEKR